VPTQGYYAHDDFDRRTVNICPEDMEQGNGHSHCMAMLLGTAGESVPVREGELQLGTWQRVLFIELDRRARPALARPGRRQRVASPVSGIFPGFDHSTLEESDASPPLRCRTAHGDVAALLAAPAFARPALSIMSA